jgi:hypothetical protein
MVASNLCLHKGARLVEPEELRVCPAPPPEGRWYPVAHYRVLDTVTETLQDAGYRVQSQQLALSRENARFFGTLNLATPVASGVSLAVGIRNSVDKSFPLGFCAGNRVFVCDNLAFRSELMVRRKHTLNGERNFGNAIANAVTALREFKDMEEERLKVLMQTELSPEVADSLILRAFEKGMLSIIHLPKVIQEWRKPSFEEFQPRTAWSLLNAFTTVLRDRAQKNPAHFAVQSMRLNALLEPHADEVACAVAN